jgi:hypothetical protein
MIDDNDEEETTGAGPLDRESALARLSDGVLMDSIVEQTRRFADAGVQPEDILSIVEDRHAYLVATYDGEGDTVRLLNDAMLSIYLKVISGICERFNLLQGTELSGPDAKVAAKNLYKFFVRDYRDNLIAFASSYVFGQRKALALEYKGASDRKDMVMASFRRAAKNQDDAVIMYNIDQIVEDTVKTMDDPKAVLDAILESDPESTHFQAISSMLTSDDWEGRSAGPDFCREFLSPFLGDEESGQLMSDVRAVVRKCLGMA